MQDEQEAPCQPRNYLREFHGPLKGIEHVPMTKEMVDAGEQMLRIHGPGPEATPIGLRIAAMMVYAAMRDLHPQCQP